MGNRRERKVEKVMKRTRWLAGILTAVLFVGCISPAEASGTEMPEETWEIQQMTEETEELSEAAENDTKSAAADANGFVIENGVLTGYRGNGGNVTIPAGVTEIGEKAFSQCHTITSVSIPDGVTKIGESAFYYCDNMVSISIPDSVTVIEWSAFYNCTKLSEITLPKNITEIKGFVFQGCASLKEIIIPENVTSIGSDAFYDCSSLEEIFIPKNVTYLTCLTFGGCLRLREIKVDEENQSFSSDEAGILYNKDKTILIECPAGKTGKVQIPDSVTEIGIAAFVDCVNITGVSIPDSVTKMGDWVFSRCINLKEVNIPKKIDQISWLCFENCISLENITIPETVTCIEQEAFYNCFSLKEVFIPKSVTEIEKAAFSNCSSLTEIKVDAANKNYSSDETGMLYNKDKTILVECQGSKTGKIEIPQSVTSIGESAFVGCKGITEINLPSNVRSIGSNAFEECTGLRRIILSENVTSIGEDVFAYCDYDNLQIICPKDSYAETYAKENQINFRYVGDKEKQTITASDAITKYLGEDAFSLNAVTDGDGALTYASDNEAVANVDSAGMVTLTGAGTAHITITAAETTDYWAAEMIVTLTVKPVDKKVQTITVSEVIERSGKAAFSLNAATNGDGILTYVSDNNSVATVDGQGIVTPVSDGTVHITVTASETENYLSAQKVVTIHIIQPNQSSNQTITAKNITKTYGDKAFSLGVKTNGGGKLTYKVLNKKIATVNKKGKVTIKGCGRTQIKITAAANGNYKKATKNITLTVKPRKLKATSVKSAKSKTVTVKWKRDKKAKGYIVQYSMDKKFKKKVKTVVISKNSTVSKTIKKLKGGKKYYVRVCAYTTADGKKIKGSYSKVMSVKVKK